MKVAFINSLYAPHEVGGAEKAVRTLAEEHVKAGGEAIVICLTPDKAASTDTLNGVKIYYVPLANIDFLHGKTALPKWKKLIWYIIDSYNPIMKTRLQKILKAEQPDVIEANNLQGFSVSAWKAAKDLGIPVVQVLHDYYLGCINSTMYTKSHNCQTQCTQCKVLCSPRRKLSDIPHTVSSVSKRTLARIQQVGMFGKPKHISIGSSGIRLSDLTGDGNKATHKAGEPLVVGYLGRLEPLKGVSLLLQAASEMPDGTIRLLIAGGGNEEYLAELKRQYTSANIEFLGIVAPRELFSQIHLLAVPSVWEEPLSRVIPEAYASGIPVAISRLGGMPEIVEDGVTGYIFEAGNPSSLKDLLNRLQKEDFPTKQQIEACKAWTHHFSVESVFQRHQDMWNKASGK